MEDVFTNDKTRFSDGEVVLILSLHGRAEVSEEDYKRDARLGAPRDVRHTAGGRESRLTC